MVNQIQLFDFQEDTVYQLLNLTADNRSKPSITVKAPTGSGKTIILIDFIDEYLSKVDVQTAFIWLCPGKGNLEEQSREKMQKFVSQRHTLNLFDALQNGFSAQSTTFINWELVTKRGNTALRDSERKNLFDRIAEAHRSGIHFFVIVDEEHSNNTAKANTILQAFAANHTVRVSATAVKNNRSEFIEIDERDVINAGLITKALYVNEGLEDGSDIENDYDKLLELADAKRKKIAERYVSLGKVIRPLVLIQFPNGQKETIQAVEHKLETMGYTTENGMVSVWMSEDKRDLPADLTQNSGTPVFLLMKQAISTGWDCPRAKILVKLREGMSENFEIQTIGRIRRMPEARHYDDDLLDFCYVYTFDETYKAGLLSTMDRAYETRLLCLKEKCKTFSLEKEVRDRDLDGLGEREVFLKLRTNLVEKYHLSLDHTQNQRLMTEAGYDFSNKINGHVLHGVFVQTASLADAQAQTYITTHRAVNTTEHGLLLMHAVDSIKRSVGMTQEKVRTILERLFRKGSGGSGQKLVSLPTAAFYAFVINNQHKLREEFRDVTADMALQTSILHPKKSVFTLPEQDFFRYDPDVKNEIGYFSSAYSGYTSGFSTSLVRSTCEQLFEQYCENRIDIDWVYKNGDSGQQYFSIVYLDGVQKQWLFYADYIVKKKDGTIWIIETKGGEYQGQSKNIDRQIENKFNAFKQYAKGRDLCWGFVRDKDHQLYLNNTEYSDSMSADSWVPLSSIF